MNVVHCDNHPDRPAAKTVAVLELRPGFRPFLAFAGFSGATVRDLCADCAASLVELGFVKTPEPHA